MHTQHSRDPSSVVLFVSKVKITYVSCWFHKNLKQQANIQWGNLQAQENQRNLKVRDTTWTYAAGAEEKNRQAQTIVQQHGIKVKTDAHLVGD